jgi:hypothetical protein
MPTKRKKNGSVQSIALKWIHTDEQLQPRGRVDLALAHEYAEAMANGDEFPPIVVFFDGKNYWLADGNTRFEAARHLKLDEIRAIVYQGTKRDAILYSAGANATHGARRTIADKKRSILKLLSDTEWCLWSDSQIAEVCKVSKSTVSKYRTNSPGLPGHNITARIGGDGEVHKTRINGHSRGTEDSDTSSVARQHAMPSTPMTKREVAEAYLRKIVKHLKSSGQTVSANVVCEVGTAEIVTPTHLYTFVSSGEGGELYRFIGRAWIIGQCINPEATIILIGHFSVAVGAIIRHAEARGIKFMTPEEVLAESEVEV